MQNMPIGIFRGDDTDAFDYQTIVGTINTDLDLTGCKAVFRYLDFSMEFDPIPEDKKITIIIPADETKKFPPGLGYASLRVYDSEGRLKTFSNRIMVFVATKTPMFGSDEFEVDFNVRASLEPLKFFVGPNPDDFDEYRGYVEKVIDRASAEKYGLAILLDAIDSDLGASDGVAATPVAVKAAYAAIIRKLTDDYYTAEQTDEAIDRVAAYYITYDAAGNPFPTYASLANAQTVYSGGKVRTPTRNDYCIVLADETHDNAEYRYIYAVADGETTGSWQPQFPVEGVMTVDPTVTRNSQNPVSGGGVWSAIWGALASLPSGDTSLYDWCVSQLAGKLDKSGGTMTGPLTMDKSVVELKDSTGYKRVLRCTGIGGDFYIDYYDSQGTLLYSLIVPSIGGTLAITASHPTAGNLAALDASGNPTDSGKKPSDFQSALSAQQLANIAAVSDALAFDATHSYTAGDPVVYNGTLYTFTTTHTGAWTGSDVSAVDIIARLAGKLGNTGDQTLDGSLTLLGIALTNGTIIYNGSIFSLPPWMGGTFALMDHIAPDFSAQSSYEVGQLVVQNFILKRCTTAGTGSAAVFASATVEDVLAALRTGKANRASHPTAGNLAALDASGNPTDSLIPAANVALKGEIPYSLGTPIVIDTASSETVEGETVNYGAATLANRTANVVQVTAATALDELRITFPAATSGKVRDFGLRVEIGTGSAALAAPALVPIAPTGETIKLENADGAIPALADGTATAKGVTLLYFSETAPGVFVVKGEQVEEVA